MKINVCKEVTNLENGEYTAEIITAKECKNGKLLMKLALENEVIFVKFFTSNDLGSYPWNNVLTALNTDDTDDLVGKKIQFEVVNNTKDGYEYSNIKKVKLV